jgi:hypothetical protein
MGMNHTKEYYFKLYDAFHSEFSGDVKNLNCGPVCEKCELNCEVCAEDDEIDYKYILSFLPFEAEYVADKMGIPLEEFKNLYCYGIRTPSGVIDMMKFERECPFLNPDFSCRLGEHKIITCKIFPVIHYPLVGLSLSRHCDLLKVPDIYRIFKDGMETYREFLEQLNPDPGFLHLRESFDVLQLDAVKAGGLLKSKEYRVLDLEEFKTLLLAEPDLI